ncbi:large ribosomal subunit protein uL6m [Trichomonascus vanleenenianus]|uniref:mitochondrial 54S ribosomal protein uL6m MRPL6 n=1 Tax=Trichomonascus vanleenenianus TaxID=2268995 RepID=UPI003ECB3A6D
MLRSIASRRLFSTASVLRSNVGSSPIIIPEGVTLRLSEKKIDEVTELRMQLDSQRKGKPKVNLTKTIELSGPKGSMQIDLAQFVNIEIENNKARVLVDSQDKRVQRSMWGTTRTLVNNAVSGVVEGHMSIIKFVGTGFRAVLETDDKNRQVLNLRVGYCVPIPIKVPADLKVSVPLPHRIIIEGVDKQRVKQLAAAIRKHRPPEPYKGKGIFVDGETIKLKARKIK